MRESEVRRTRRGGTWVRTDPVRDLVLGALAIGSVGFLLARGADPVVLVGVVVAGLAVGVVAAVVPGSAQLGLLLLSVPASWSAILVLDHWVAFLPCAAAVRAGFSGVVHARALRDGTSRGQRRREQRGGGGAPVRGPAWGAAAGALRVEWDEGEDSCEALEPGRDDVLDLVGRLDGAERTILTLRRGAARLDVAGDAAGRMLVMWSDDTSNNHSWHRVQDDSLGDERVEVAIAGRRGRFRAHATTTVTAARKAAAAFVDHARRPSDVTWFNDRHHVWAMRPPGMDD